MGVIPELLSTLGKRTRFYGSSGLRVVFLEGFFTFQDYKVFFIMLSPTENCHPLLHSNIYSSIIILQFCIVTLQSHKLKTYYAKQSVSSAKNLCIV